LKNVAQDFKIKYEFHATANNVNDKGMSKIITLLNGFPLNILPLQANEIMPSTITIMNLRLKAKAKEVFIKKDMTGFPSWYP